MQSVSNLQNLNFDSAQVLYDDHFLAKHEQDLLYSYFSQLFQRQQNRKVTNPYNNKSHYLARKTMVFIEPKTVNTEIIPKIWGDDVTVREFTTDLLRLKEKIEQATNFHFNICLANYYDTGNNTIGYHSDNEEKGSTSCIASVSIGAERVFSFRTKSSGKIYKDMRLRSGSLLIMGDGCQENYEHSLLKYPECKKPRLNLTFRLFDPERYSNH